MKYPTIPTKCEYCDQPLDDKTGETLDTPNGYVWRLVCSKCKAVHIAYVPYIEYQVK